MKRFIVSISFALAMIIAIPAFGQTSAAEWQKKVDKLQLQLDSTNNKIKAAEEAALNAKTQDEKTTAQADRKSALDENHKVAAQLKEAKVELAKAQAAEGISEPQNNDPSPQIVDGDEVNDTASMVEAAADSTEVVEDAGTKDAEKSSFPWWMYLLMFGLPVLCSGFVYFILNSKIEELKMRFKADSQASQRELNQRLKNLADKTNRIESSVGSVRQDMRNRDRVIEQRPPVSPYGAPAQPVQPKRPTEFYLSMPSPDGSWSEVSTVNTQGQCLYILNSPDGVNGTFRVINEPIAIQMILMGVGKYLNPVCRVSNTASQVSGIVTDEPGTAVFENGVWRMTKKAVVHYV